jgi:hypothetical protein
MIDFVYTINNKFYTKYIKKELIINYLPLFLNEIEYEIINKIIMIYVKSVGFIGTLNVINIIDEHNDKFDSLTLKYNLGTSINLYFIEVKNITLLKRIFKYRNYINYCKLKKINYINYSKNDDLIISKNFSDFFDIKNENNEEEDNYENNEEKDNDENINNEEENNNENNEEEDNDENINNEDEENINKKDDKNENNINNEDEENINKKDDKNENNINKIRFKIPILWIPCLNLIKLLEKKRLSKKIFKDHYNNCLECENNNNNKNFQFNFDKYKTKVNFINHFSILDYYNYYNDPVNITKYNANNEENKENDDEENEENEENEYNDVSEDNNLSEEDIILDEDDITRDKLIEKIVNSYSTSINYSDTLENLKIIGIDDKLTNILYYNNINEDHIYNNTLFIIK